MLPSSASIYPNFGTRARGQRPKTSPQPRGGSCLFNAMLPNLEKISQITIILLTSKTLKVLVDDLIKIVIYGRVAGLNQSRDISILVINISNVKTFDCINPKANDRQLPSHPK